MAGLFQPDPTPEQVEFTMSTQPTENLPRLFRHHQQNGRLGTGMFVGGALAAMILNSGAVEALGANRAPLQIFANFIMGLGYLHFDATLRMYGEPALQEAQRRGMAVRGHSLFRRLEETQ